jgi:hypothetical protein
MNASQLAAEQLAMLARHPKRIRAKTHGSSPEGRAEQKAWRATQPASDVAKVLRQGKGDALFMAQNSSDLRSQMKSSRRKCRRLTYFHKRFLSLKRDRRKVTRTLLNELHSLLPEFRALNATLREAKSELRGTLSQRQRASRDFAAGLEMGREECRMRALQSKLDQQGKGINVR